MTYPKPNITSVESLVDHADTLSKGWLVPMFLMGLWVIFFTLLKGKYYRVSDSLAIASLVTFFLSALLWAAGLVEGRIILLFLVLLAITSLYSFLDSS